MGKAPDRIARRERRIDEALQESFPASDPPFFVAAGEPSPRHGATKPGGEGDPDVEEPAEGAKAVRKKR